MTNKGVKFIVYAIAMCLLYVLLGYLNNRDNTVKNSGQDEIHYVVKIPGTLKYIYASMFFLGIIMFFTFFIFKLKGNPTVTTGHFRVALIFAGIGLGVMIWSTKWRLVVNGDELEIHRFLHKSEIFSISEIEKAEIGTKDQVILYKNGKKIVTVDGLSDNYDRFKETLQKYGKIK